MTIDEINALDHDPFVAAVGWIFEHSPWVAERSWKQRPFANVDDLLRAMTAEVERADPSEQLALLRAHPDLGAKARMSASSTEEQTSAGLDQLTAQEFDHLHQLNRAYKEKFGFPFLFAVKGSNKSQILEALEVRINSDMEEEFQVALQQVNAIAGFRLRDLIDNHQMEPDEQIR